MGQPAVVVGPSGQAPEAALKSPAEEIVYSAKLITAIRIAALFFRQEFIIRRNFPHRAPVLRGAETNNEAESRLAFAD